MYGKLFCRVTLTKYLCILYSHELFWVPHQAHPNSLIQDTARLFEEAFRNSFYPIEKLVDYLIKYQIDISEYESHCGNTSLRIIIDHTNMHRTNVLPVR